MDLGDYERSVLFSSLVRERVLLHEGNQLCVLELKLHETLLWGARNVTDVLHLGHGAPEGRVGDMVVARLLLGEGHEAARARVRIFEVGRALVKAPAGLVALEAEGAVAAAPFITVLDQLSERVEELQTHSTTIHAEVLSTGSGFTLRWLALLLQAI